MRTTGRSGDGREASGTASPAPHPRSEEQPPGPRPVASPPGRLTRAGTIEAVALWLGSRAAIAAFSLLASWVLRIDGGGRLQGSSRWVLERFTWYDSFQFLRNAERGYIPPEAQCCSQAFFPGYPLSMRLLAPVVGGNHAAAGVLVSLVAGSVAAVLLWHVGTWATGTARGGRTAVVLLAVAPYGFFLSAVYSEALFLAFALGAWYAGLRRQWWIAGLLAGLATAVRINGLFLAAALAVMYLLQLRADGRRWPRWDVLALLAPLVSVLAFFTHLYRLTGSWTAWFEAEERGWDRELAWPWQGMAAGVEAIGRARSPDLVVARWADLLVAVFAVALVVVLLSLRRWAEAVYVLLNTIVLVCSTTLVSGPRYAVLWFPTYLLLAQLAERPRFGWLRPALVIACVPLLAYVTLTFSAHRWTA